MTEGEDDAQLVDSLISRLSEREGIGASEARMLLHRSLCAGTCEWYRKRGEEIGFDRLAVGEARGKRIKALVCEVMGPVTEDEARRRIHLVLCGS